MPEQGRSSGELEILALTALEEAASRLGQVLAELASQLRPFPSFLNMVSIQAIELEPAFQPTEDRGCVVVCPDGGIRQLELTGIPGVSGVNDVEAVEQFNELDLPFEEYIVYASSAIRLLVQEMGRRRR